MILRSRNFPRSRRLALSVAVVVGRGGAWRSAMRSRRFMAADGVVDGAGGYQSCSIVVSSCFFSP